MIWHSLLGTVDPGTLHACREATEHIQRPVIAHMQDGLRRQCQSLCRMMKDTHIGFLMAHLPGSDHASEIRAKPHPMHVCVAIGK